jgi:hypothetical protein
MRTIDELIEATRQAGFETHDPVELTLLREALRMRKGRFQLWDGGDYNEDEDAVVGCYPSLDLAVAEAVRHLEAYSAVRQTFRVRDLLGGEEVWHSDAWHAAREPVPIYPNRDSLFEHLDMNEWRVVLAADWALVRAIVNREGGLEVLRDLIRHGVLGKV